MNYPMDPVHRCQSPYCDRRGPYVREEAVVSVESKALVVGWCAFCERFVCSRCALQISVADEEVSKLVTTAGARRQPLYWLHCARCGTRLRRDEGRKARVLD